MLFFLSPPVIACLICLFNGADHVFHSVLRKDVPMHFSLYSLLAVSGPRVHQPTRFILIQTHKPSLELKENTDARTIIM